MPDSLRTPSVLSREATAAAVASALGIPWDVHNIDWDQRSGVAPPASERSPAAVALYVELVRQRAEYRPWGGRGDAGRAEGRRGRPPFVADWVDDRFRSLAPEAGWARLPRQVLLGRVVGEAVAQGFDVVGPRWCLRALRQSLEADRTIDKDAVGRMWGGFIDWLVITADQDHLHTRQTLACRGQWVKAVRHLKRDVDNRPWANAEIVELVELLAVPDELMRVLEDGARAVFADLGPESVPRRLAILPALLFCSYLVARDELKDMSVTFFREQLEASRPMISGALSLLHDVVARAEFQPLEAPDLDRLADPAVHAFLLATLCGLPRMLRAMAEAALTERPELLAHIGGELLLATRPVAITSVGQQVRGQRPGPH
jgi:hypothetical protein